VQDLGIFLRPLPFFLGNLIGMLEGILNWPAKRPCCPKLAMVIGGCLIGHVHWDMLPGLGPMSIIAIMIPIAFHWVIIRCAILLAGV